MAEAFAGYDEPAAPDRKLATDRRTRGADDVDLQQIVLFDETAENGAAVDASGRLKVDASGVAVPVTDNASSLTVDAPVGTPVFVRLSDGSTAIATLPVDTELPPAGALGDTLANPTTPMLGANSLLWDDSSSVWRRARANHTVFGLASAARTATNTTADIPNINWRGLHLILNVTSAGTGSITPKITGRETIIGTDYNVMVATAAVTANGTYVYELYPGVGAAADGITQAASRVLPRTFRVTITHNNANSITYSWHLCGLV